MGNVVITGKVYRFGDNINTDLISPAQYMEMDNETIAKHAMEGADEDFSKKFQKGGIIVAGKNFGSGSSRETAPMALKGIGVSVVIAQFFARIFYRNSINIGLPVLICPNANEINDNDELEIVLSTGIIKNITTGKEYSCTALPQNIIDIINDGGLIGHLKKNNLI